MFTSVLLALKTVNCEMDNLHYRQFFWDFFRRKKENSRKKPFKITTNSKIWLRNVVKYVKYSFAKFANFVFFVSRGENITTFEPEMATISARNTKILTKFWQETGEVHTGDTDLVISL